MRLQKTNHRATGEERSRCVLARQSGRDGAANTGVGRKEITDRSALLVGALVFDGCGEAVLRKVESFREICRGLATAVPTLVFESGRETGLADL